MSRKGKERKSKGGRKVEEREVAPGVVELAIKFGDLTHFMTEISPCADRDAALRAYLESQPFGAMYLARKAVFWAKRYLRDHNLPTKSTPDKPLLDHLEDLGYEPLDEQWIAAELLVRGGEILKLPMELESTIEQAMGFGQALYKQHLIAEIARVKSEHGKTPKKNHVRKAVTAWAAENTGKKQQRVYNSFPIGRTNCMNVGEYQMWRDGKGHFFVDHPDLAEPLKRSLSTFKSLLSEIKAELKN